jgi:glycosyltransferase involved in cell wall biosynthesis
MKKVCFFEARSKKIYGAQKSMLTLIENIDSKEISSFLVTSINGEVTKYAKNKGINNKVIKATKVINDSGGKIFKLNFIQKILILVQIIIYNFKIYRYFFKNKIDMLYVNDNKGFLLTFIAAKLYGVPIISYKRTTKYYKESKLIKYLEYIEIKFSDLILCISKGVRSNISLKLREKFIDKIKILYTGYNFSEFKTSENQIDLYDKYNIKSNNKIVALIGSITPRKGHKILVDSMNLVLKKHPNAIFMFLGGEMENQEDYFNLVLGKIKKYKLEENVIWTGYVNNISEYYNIIDCVVLPSYAEGLPRTVIESLSNGIPVVANDVGGVKEIITNNDLGYIIENNSHKMLAEGINKFLYENKNKKKVLRQKYVEEKFSLEKYVSRFIELVSNL